MLGAAPRYYSDSASSSAAVTQACEISSHRCIDTAQHENALLNGKTSNSVSRIEAYQRSAKKKNGYEEELSIGLKDE